jgi:hypothetical protein
MSTLSTYLTLLTQKLAQSNTGFHTSADRNAAINEAILKIADNYEIPELRKKPVPSGTITFTNGLATIPSDFLRMIKLWDTIIPPPFGEYTYLVNDLFDDQAINNSSLFWTIDFDPVSATQKFYIISPNPSPITVNMRYIVLPTVLVNPNDESGLTAQWDNSVAYKGASILFNNEHNPAGGVMEQSFNTEIIKAYEAISKIGGVKAGERIRSRFEKYPLLNAPQV